MLRVGVTALAFVALVHGVPTPTEEKAIKDRQFQIGPSPTVIWGGTTLTAIPSSGPGILPPITGGLNPPPRKRQGSGPVLGGSEPTTLKAHIIALELEYEKLVQKYGKNPPASVAKREKEIQAELKKYGITIVQTPDGTSTTITFGKQRREISTGPVLGGSDPTGLQAHIISLELEYEYLVQEYGKNPPRAIAKREEEIANELKKYGITIVQTPDGTTTIITPGKVKRQDLNEDVAYGSASFDLAGLQSALQSLWHQYGSSPPHDAYIVEENIKHILLAYGATIVQSPDGTSTIDLPSAKRSSPDYDIGALEKILESLMQKYDGERPPLADWLVMQHISAVLKSYGITIEKSPDGTSTILKPSDKRGVVQVGDSVNIIALQSLLALLEATYGANPPRDILLIEQTIATILSTQGIIVPGFPIPGGSITPDPTIPGGVITPDPTIPGGTITPDPSTPGGGLNPSTKRSEPDFDVEGLKAALAQLEAEYGSYGSGTIPVSVFIIMQNIVTILQAEGVTVPGWPILGGGSTIIGPSD